jgi:hypothetical protein
VLLVAAATTDAQYHERALERAREVKMLVDDREGVRRIFHDFNLDRSTDVTDGFSFGETEVEVTYSSGVCDEAEDEIWDAPAGRVVKIEIEESGLIPNDLKVDRTNLEREQMYFGSENYFILHSKAKGLAIEIDEDEERTGVELIILFPSAGMKAKTCNTKFAKEFVELKSWFGSKKLKDRHVCNWKNGPANVTDLSLSHDRVTGTTASRIDIVTTAVDPENDVLLYSYTVTGGRIIGGGANVKWDLTGVRPGTYTVIVGVDDGAGIVGKTFTRTVVVE